MNRLAAVVLLLPLLLIVCPAVGHAQESQTVVEIVFQGNVTVTDAFLARHIQLAQGKPYDRAVENEDVKRLYQLGHFRNIEVKREAVAGGLRIIFVLDESKTVGQIQLVGFENIDEKDIRAVMRLKEGRPYDPFLERQDRRAIEQMYRAKGYQFASVRVVPDRKAPPDKANLRFYVTEGPKVGLETIRFTGNNSFSAKRLKEVMQLEENGWLWFLREAFDTDLLKADLVELRRFYRDHGFLDVEVALANVEFTADKRDMEVLIHVEEGPRYKVGNVEIAGNKLFSTKELTDRLTIQSGAFFDRRKIRKDVRKLIETYADNARMFARIIPGEAITLDTQLVHVIFQIDEGRRIFIDRVDIQGNDTTRDDVIRRQIELFPGDPFNQSKLRRTRQNLLSLNFFETVGFDQRPSETGDESMLDLLVQVKEGRTGALRFAAGVTSNAGLIGEISYTQRNFDISRWPSSWDDLVNGDAFKGGGQLLTVQFQPGTERNQFRIGFREPAWLGSQYSLEAELQATARARETYDETRFSSEFTVGRKLWRREVLAETGLRLERINIDADSGAPKDVLAVDGSNSLISLLGGLHWDRRNNTLQPSKGYRMGTNLQFTFGDFNYVKNDYRATYYRTITETEDGRPHILTARARLGLGLGGDIPVFDRYFAGGHGSVRGFEFRSISPKEKGDPIGGDFLGLINVEYSVPLYKETLRGVVFLDLGGVGAGFGDVFSELRASAGFGVRLRIPGFGPVPVALDFGFPFRKQSDDDTKVFSFALGRSF